MRRRHIQIRHILRKANDGMSVRQNWPVPAVDPSDISPGKRGPKRRCLARYLLDLLILTAAVRLELSVNILSSG